MKTLKLRQRIDYTRAISGLFISWEHPSGVTPKEITVFSVLWSMMLYYNESKITPRIKRNTADILKMELQILTNYIGKLKKKKLINKNNTLNDLFKDTNILIKLIPKPNVATNSSSDTS